MKVHEIKKNFEELYHLKANRINIVEGENGTLFFPDVEHYCTVKIILLNGGRFKIDPTYRMIKLGSDFYDLIKTDKSIPGNQAVHEFLYIPKKQVWFSMTEIYYECPPTEKN